MTYEITESPATTDEKDSRKSELKKARFRTATALSTSDTVSLYGSCHAEDIKAYTGIDNQTGQTLDRSHKKISGYKSRTGKSTKRDITIR